MAMQTMYAPANNGPRTALATGINSSITTMTVDDASIFPAAPNVLTIGATEDAELVLYTNITGNIITIERGYNGTTAAAWPEDTYVYRAITAQDVSSLQNNINELGTTKQDVTSSLSAETALADADTVPFYDASASGHRKTTWSNIKAVLKTYFDTVYTSALVALTGYSKAAEAAAVAATDTINQAIGKLEKLLDGKATSPTAVTGTGSITVTVEANKEYSYTAVTSLTMTGAAVNCHGFVTFDSSTPTISVSSFTDSSGDDIADAAASEVWEFSVFNGYVVWKNWSA